MAIENDTGTNNSTPEEMYTQGVSLIASWFDFDPNYDKEEASAGQELIKQAASNGYIPAKIKEAQYEERTAQMFKAKNIMDSASRIASKSETDKNESTGDLEDSLVKRAREEYKRFYVENPEFKRYAALALVESFLKKVYDDYYSDGSNSEELELWFERAMHSGSMKSALLYAIYLLERTKIDDVNLAQEAISHLVTAANSGEPDACLLIGNALCSAEKYELGLSWLEKAKEHGSRFASYNIILVTKKINPSTLDNSIYMQLIDMLKEFELTLHKDEECPRFQKKITTQMGACMRVMYPMLNDKGVKLGSWLEFHSIIYEVARDNIWSEQLIYRLDELADNDDVFAFPNDCLWGYANLPEFKSECKILEKANLIDKYTSKKRFVKKDESNLKGKGSYITSHLLESLLVGILIGIIPGLILSAIGCAILESNVEGFEYDVWSYLLGVMCIILIPLVWIFVSGISDIDGTMERHRIKHEAYNKKMDLDKNNLISRLQLSNLEMRGVMIETPHLFINYPFLPPYLNMTETEDYWMRELDPLLLFRKHLSENLSFLVEKLKAV